MFLLLVLPPKKRIGFFVEKPLSNSYESAEELEQYLSLNNVTAQVGFHMRHIPTFVKGRELLCKLGEISKVNVELYVTDVLSEQKGWRYDPILSGGGVLMDFAIHAFDLLYWYFGRVSKISCITRKAHSLHVEDEADVEFNFLSGSRAVLKTSWSLPGYRLPFIKVNINGSNGDLFLTDHSVHLLTKDSEIKLSIADLYQGYFLDIAGPHYSVQMLQFVDLLKSNSLKGNLKSSVYVQRLVHLAYQSAANETEIIIN
jgi:scyllo-inositol 2-dehydrogenase (NADP+)